MKHRQIYILPIHATFVNNRTPMKKPKRNFYYIWYLKISSPLFNFFLFNRYNCDLSSTHIFQLSISKLNLGIIFPQHIMDTFHRLLPHLSTSVQLPHILAFSFAPIPLDIATNITLLFIFTHFTSYLFFIFPP